MTYIQKEDSFGPYTKVTVTAENGTSFSIVPEMGARLNNLAIPLNEGKFDIIDGFASGDELTTEYYSKSSLLIPFPNRIAGGTYEFAGEAYQLPLNKPDEGNSIHGFISNKSFTLKRSEAVGADYELEFYYASGAVEGYPFPFEILVIYRLMGSGALRINTEIKNTGVTKMPIGIGWHPYFKTGARVDDLQLRLPQIKELEVNSKLIPTGEMNDVTKWMTPKSLSGVEFDTGFQFVTEDKQVSLHDTENNLEIKIICLEGYKYVQVFIPPWRTSIAIEPMTCAADAFNNKLGLEVLNPGETQRSVFEIVTKVS